MVSKDAFALNFVVRLSSWFSSVAPRVNFGLNQTVIKSHGSADETGVAAALHLAYRLAESGFSDKLAARVASAASLAQDASTASGTDGSKTKTGK